MQPASAALPQICLTTPQSCLHRRRHYAKLNHSLNGGGHPQWLIVHFTGPGPHRSGTKEEKQQQHPSGPRSWKMCNTHKGFMQWPCNRKLETSTWL